MASIRVVSVNVSLVQRVKMGDRWIPTGILKRAVDGPVVVGSLGLAGDEQADPAYHGGLDKAVYAYPSEHYPFWLAKRQVQTPAALFEPDQPFGFMGENLSLQGLMESQVWLGDELHFPDCVLRVTAPRDPCGKFNAIMGYNAASRDMAMEGCSGFYLAVERMGSIEAGQSATLAAGQRAVSVQEAFRAKFAKHVR
jgi:MOSC domain-containing protein YiiM